MNNEDNYDFFIDSMVLITEKFIEFDINIRLCLTVYCENIFHEFVIREIEIKYDTTEIVMVYYYYNIFHMSKNDSCHKKFFLKTEIRKIFDELFEMSWKYRLCMECTSLIPKENGLCSKCIYHKYRQEYGIKKGIISEHNTCMICHENVYNTRLECGHSIHHKCLIRLNPNKWYDKNLNIKCCICRQTLSDTDVHKYFLLY